jgi:hypothetical protein
MIKIVCWSVSCSVFSRLILQLDILVSAQLSLPQEYNRRKWAKGTENATEPICCPIFKRCWQMPWYLFSYKVSGTKFHIFKNYYFESSDCEGLSDKLSACQYKLLMWRSVLDRASHSVALWTATLPQRAGSVVQCAGRTSQLSQARERTPPVPNPLPPHPQHGDTDLSNPSPR